MNESTTLAEERASVLVEPTNSALEKREPIKVEKQEEVKHKEEVVQVPRVKPNYLQVLEKQWNDKGKLGSYKN